MLNEELLEERLMALEAARPWSPRAVSRLEARIRSGDDDELFRVNPIEYAGAAGLEASEAIDLFLHATKAGLFDLDWNVVCGGCGNTSSSVRSLAMVDPHMSCAVCQVSAEADLDDLIQVTFTVAPAVRRIAYHDPAALPIEAFLDHYLFSHDLKRDDHGRTNLDLLRDFTRLLTYVEPGEAASIELDVQGMFVSVRDALHATSVIYWIVDDADAPAAIDLTLRDGRFEDPAQTFEPYTLEQPVGRFEWRMTGRITAGAVPVTIRNAMAERAAIWLLVYPPPPGPLERLEFEPMLSGKRLLSTQTFRTLFRSETVPIDESLQLRDLTFLFTDLQGSTAMYDRIGDATAYNLVRLHFDTLESAVRDQGGALVKTIGDAVMATFVDPTAAVRAGLAMLDRLAAYNESASTALGLRVGVHRGHAIAVTLNDQLDYFGQTVNIAARVQALAEAGELAISEDARGDPDVEAILGGREVRQVPALMKGVRESIAVFCVGPARAG